MVDRKKDAWLSAKREEVGRTTLRLSQLSIPGKNQKSEKIFMECPNILIASLCDQWSRLWCIENFESLTKASLFSLGFITLLRTAKTGRVGIRMVGIVKALPSVYISSVPLYVSSLLVGQSRAAWLVSLVHVWQCLEMLGIISSAPPRL